jgi:hypothetical protein
MGESAIDKLLDVLGDLRRANLPAGETLGATTMNVGRIAGGVAANVIPPEAEAELMYRRVMEIRERVLPGDHPETVKVLGRYAGLLDKMGRGNEDRVTEDRAKMMRARLEGKGHRLSGRDTDAP